MVKIEKANVYFSCSWVTPDGMKALIFSNAIGCNNSGNRTETGISLTCVFLNNCIKASATLMSPANKNNSGAYQIACFKGTDLSEIVIASITILVSGRLLYVVDVL